jgi:hypothetical protein
VSVTEAAAAVDDLFRRAVESPDEIDDPVLVDWLADASDSLGPVVSKEDARVLRLAVRLARKLAGYWSERRDATLPDWRNGVDEALGSRGWEVQLDLVMNALQREPDRGLFEEAKTRFRAARFEEWMEGVAYEEWAAGGDSR